MGGHKVGEVLLEPFMAAVMREVAEDAVCQGSPIPLIYGMFGLVGAAVYSLALISERMAVEGALRHASKSLGSNCRRIKRDGRRRGHQVPGISDAKERSRCFFIIAWRVSGHPGTIVLLGGLFAARLRLKGDAG